MNGALSTHRQPGSGEAYVKPATAAAVAADKATLIDKLSYLPFIIKAVSMALYQYPILNARVEIPEGYATTNNNNNNNCNPKLRLGIRICICKYTQIEGEGERTHLLQLFLFD